ncbi:hypothetical protein [[Erwinia] mediterraneensis]|uniref:hypothetical protein n=1 Tax=[Erwinia] mediterraneensis TaxID=2161819 RepID=UPI0010304A8D|nr:hypothetical protein [[Erwinia] mediterraneensis]
MLRDYLKLEAEDQLLQEKVTHLKTRGQEDITEWAIVDKNGKKKGFVSLFDKLNTRRSYCVNYRITQKDLNGKVIVDHLTDTL